MTSRAAIDPPAWVVVDCDVADSVPAIKAPGPGATAMVLVRLFTEPLAMLRVAIPQPGLDPAELTAVIVSELEAELSERIEECGLPWTGELPPGRPPRIPRFLAGRERVLREGPEITVAVCTRDRTPGLARLLRSLGAQRYPRMTVLVIDNAPSDDSTRRLVAELDLGVEITYEREPRPGLSWARNRALEAAGGEVIAWADDDETCDPWWLAELARAFVEVPDADAATGIVVAAELDTRCQVWFEQYSGVHRGRGFRRAIFSPATGAQQSPLYPLPPFGIGANMAFRRDALRRIGGFDTALGIGTATLAGEDTAALSTLLLAGGTVVYQPSAIVHHSHRRDYAALERVMRGYGRGLTAYYASMVARHPQCLPELMRLSGPALRDLLHPDGQRLSQLDDFPPALLAVHRRGLLQGAFMYPRARLRARRLAGGQARTR